MLDAIFYSSGIPRGTYPYVKLPMDLRFNTVCPFRLRNKKCPFRGGKCSLREAYVRSSYKFAAENPKLMLSVQLSNDPKWDGTEETVQTCNLALAHSGICLKAQNGTCPRGHDHLAERDAMKMTAVLNFHGCFNL